MRLGVRVGIQPVQMSGGAPAWTPTDAAAQYWHDADLNITLNGPIVAGWGDQSGNAYHLISIAPADEPLWRATGGPGGRTAVEADTTAKLLERIALVFGPSHTFVMGINLLSISAAYDAVHDAPVNRIIFMAHRSGGVGFWEGGDQVTGAAQLGEQVLAWTLDNGTGFGTIYRDGVAIGAPLPFAGGNIGVVSYLWAGVGLGITSAISRIWKVAYWDRVLTAGELALANAWAAV